ncbi:TonB-dependent receptor [Hirschia baltica]|uniref:TonB-dependent receptor n=1 Tax=Hirschia baltica (strain ATCC 49814 / DSM 5838 / IFAM 1418) TaxID=582402 RepID=C6XNJ0_HIRBI|nr:TonB-dependent receptor [Hirschia baltica]ACT60134.1 TonB-dependent receptor [Hirschia baltica ATCC 49814]
MKKTGLGVTKRSALNASKRTGMLLRGVSIFTLASGVWAGAAFAQDADAVEGGKSEDKVLETITVTGIRASLKSAQDLKQDADVFVDAITADDIGSLPDRSVSEALQRVPGVNVLRFAAADDPDHFAVEGSGVVVRGLPFVRSELNGRDVFGAGNSGGLGFEDVSPELLGSVQVFKNQSADMVEGGLAGTIDLRTRLPFDSAGRKVGFSADLTHSDLVGKISPTYSGLWSDRFETGAGEFGFLIGYANSSLESRSDATSIADVAPNLRDGNTFTPVQFDSLSNGQTLSDGAGNSYNFGEVEDGLYYIPRGVGIKSQLYDRGREALSLAGQWQNNSGTMVGSVQFLRSEADLTWSEKVLESNIDGGLAQNILPQDDDFVFESDRTFYSGLLSENVGWRGNDNNLPLDGSQHLATAREHTEKDVTTDLGVNLKYTPNDRWALNFDAQYVEADKDIKDVSVHGTFFSAFELDMSGEVPNITYRAPVGSGQSDAEYFADTDNYFIRSTMPHLEDSHAESIAFRGDAEYDFDGEGWLKSVRFGARYSDRDSSIQQSRYNWGNVSEIWTGSPLLLASDPTVSANMSPYSFNEFQRGSNQLGGVPFWSGPLAADYQGYLDVMNGVLSTHPGASATLLEDRGNVVSGREPFVPSEIVDVERKSTALYSRLDFGSEGLFGSNVSLDGNVGVRYVKMDRTVEGTLEVDDLATAIPTLAPDGSRDVTCSNMGGGALPGVCSLTDAEFAAVSAFFGPTAVATPQTVENSREYFLPSLNLKFEFGNGHLIRLGASKSIRDANLLDLSVGGRVTVGPDNGGEFGGVISSIGNPNLAPIESTQFDASYEWYFDETGSLTVSLFSKDLENRWVGEMRDGGSVTGGNRVPVTLVNNGVSIESIATTVSNAQETTNIKGFEIAYQQFYDMLPAPFDGFGIQANYTYIDAEDLDTLGEGAQQRGRFLIDAVGFERISEHQYNLVGLYEKGPVQARLAWNWRDDFLLTKRDVIYPFASIYQEATGQLDASFFYDINDNLKVGLQGVNLLDDVTETSSTINPNGLRGPRAFNRNDRRYSLVLRANF